MKENLSTNLSANETYRLLLDHLSKRSKVKIDQQLEPSLIEARIRSYFVSNPCDVKMELSPEKTRTIIKLNFNFTMTYMLCFFLWIFMQVLMIALFGVMDTIFIGSWTTAIVLSSGLCVSVRRTKKSFMEEIASVILIQT